MSIGVIEIPADFTEKTPLDNAVARLNKWLETNKIRRVINIETVVTTVGGGMVSVDEHITAIRCWYELEP